MSRLIPVFSAKLESNTPRAFSYSPKADERQLVGLLASSDAKVSIALNGGTKVINSDLFPTMNADCSPQEKAFSCPQEITGDIKGTITLLGKSKTVNLYLQVL